LRPARFRRLIGAGRLRAGLGHRSPGRRPQAFRCAAPSLWPRIWPG